MRNSGMAIGVALLLSVLHGTPAVAAGLEGLRTDGPTEQAQATGRVVATITTLEGTVHMPGVQVELRDEQRIVIAKTLTDAAGQVTFPDVPPGRYIITASRPGFEPKDSTVFVVHAGDSAQVILDTKLVLVLPGVQVHAATPSPTDSVQPVSM